MYRSPSPNDAHTSMHSYDVNDRHDDDDDDDDANDNDDHCSGTESEENEEHHNADINIEPRNDDILVQITTTNRLLVKLEKRQRKTEKTLKV